MYPKAEEEDPKKGKFGIRAQEFAGEAVVAARGRGKFAAGQRQGRRRTNSPRGAEQLGKWAAVQRALGILCRPTAQIA